MPWGRAGRCARSGRCNRGFRRLGKPVRRRRRRAPQVERVNASSPDQRTAKRGSWGKPGTAGYNRVQTANFRQTAPEIHVSPLVALLVAGLVVLFQEVAAEIAG